MSKFEKLRVLIAGRDDRVASRLTNLLPENYAVVASVTSGEEAVTGSQWLRPDLVFMEGNLEGEVGGLEAAEEIAMTTPTKILFLGDSQFPSAFAHDRVPDGIAFLTHTADDQTVLSMADTLSRTVTRT